MDKYINLKEIAIDYVINNDDKLTILVDRYIRVINEVMESKNIDCIDFIDIVLALATLITNYDEEFIHPITTVDMMRDSVIAFDHNVADVRNLLGVAVDSVR